MGVRRSARPAAPPPLRGIVLDGANVAATATLRAMERIDLALAWCRAFRADLPIVVFVDHRTIGRWSADARAELRRRCDAAGDAERAVRYVVVPRGEAADPHVLRHAVATAALVVSNDRFAEHAARRGTVVLQFECARGRFRPYAEATWFTPDGGAQRVAVADLR